MRLDPNLMFWNNLNGHFRMRGCLTAERDEWQGSKRLKSMRDFKPLKVTRFLTKQFALARKYSEEQKHRRPLGFHDEKFLFVLFLGNLINFNPERFWNFNRNLSRSIITNNPEEQTKTMRSRLGAWKQSIWSKTFKFLRFNFKVSHMPSINTREASSVQILLSAAFGFNLKKVLFNNRHGNSKLSHIRQQRKHWKNPQWTRHEL